MPGLLKLVFVVLVIFAVWYAMRWVNSGRPPITPRRSAQPRPMIEAEDLVPCRACGTYMPVSARNCGKPGCPLPS